MGRPYNRSIGARSAASAPKECLGPYATRDHRQSHHTGLNTRDMRQTSTRRPREDHASTNQPIASSSSRQATDDRASPTMVVLHPHRPFYFTRRGYYDVHVWTSIADRWLRTIRREPSIELTYVVPLLRGAAFEWYSSSETSTVCPGDYTTLPHAMIKLFGSSTRAKKACAAFL